MQKNSKTRILSTVVLPAVMPAILMPVMLNPHAPDYLLGGVTGVFLGLATLGLLLMVKRGGRCLPPAR